MVNTVSAHISAAAQRLGSRFDAGQLMSAALGCEPSMLPLRLRDTLTPEQAQSFDALVRRRESGEPLQYILGEWEFYGLKFFVGEGVLIPRQDTETLIDRILERCGKAPRILELGAGSGCICCTLKKLLPSASVTAIEKSSEAFAYLEKNVALNAVTVDIIWADALFPEQCPVEGLFDVIVSNPPYLTATDMHSLQCEVRREPQCALYGGEDGLDLYRGFTRAWAQRLAQDGSLFYEAGCGQTEDIAQIMRLNGLEITEAFPDATGKLRVVRGASHKAFCLF